MTLLIEGKSEAGEPHTVKHPLEEGGHAHPPVRIQDHQMVSPPYILLHRYEVRLKGLNLTVPLVQNGVELQLAKINSLDVMSRSAGSLFVCIGELCRKSLTIGVP